MQLSSIRFIQHFHWNNNSITVYLHTCKTYSETHLNVHQQIIHVGHCKPIEKGIRLMHLHSKIIVFCTDVLRQKVYGLGAAIADPNLRAKQTTQKGVTLCIDCTMTSESIQHLCFLHTLLCSSET